MWLETRIPVTRKWQEPRDLERVCCIRIRCLRLVVKQPENWFKQYNVFEIKHQIFGKIRATRMKEEEERGGSPWNVALHVITGCGRITRTSKARTR